MATPYYLTFANGKIKSKETGWKGKCGVFARESFKVQSDGTPDAAHQYSRAKHKHAGDKHPPAGVPVFWTGGSTGHGHVAVTRDANGSISSTDFDMNGYVGDGRVHISSIAAVNTDHGLHYAGWTEDIDGVTVWHAPAKPPTPAPKPDPTPTVKLVPYPGAEHFKLGHSDPAVTQLGRWMLGANLTPHHRGSVYVPGPEYSSFDLANVKTAQLAQGFTGTDADGLPGPKTWDAIQEAYFKVTGKQPV